MTLRKEIHRTIRSDQETGHRTCYVSCHVFAKDILCALNQDPANPTIEWAKQYIERVSKLGFTIDSPDCTDFDPISVVYTLQGNENGTFPQAIASILKWVPLWQEYITVTEAEDTEVLTYEFQRNRYTTAELKKHLLRHHLARTPPESNANSPSTTTGSRNAEENVLGQTGAMVQLHAEENVLSTPTSDKRDTLSQCTSVHTVTSAQDPPDLEQDPPDTDQVQSPTAQADRTLLQLLRESDARLIKAQEDKIILQAQLLESRTKQIELQNHMLTQQTREPLQQQQTTTRASPRRPMPAMSIPLDIDDDDVPDPRPIRSPRTTSRRQFAKAKRNYQDHMLHDDTKGAMCYFHDGDMTWMLHDAFAKTNKHTPKRTLQESTEILEVYEDIRDRAQSHGIRMTNLEDITKWKDQQAPPTCPYNEHDTVDYRRVYLLATAAIYQRIVGTLSFKHCDIYQRYVTQYREKQDGYAVLYHMLCRTHPALRQVNNVPIPTLDKDIWTFIKAYRGYVQLKLLNGEDIPHDTQYTYVKRQLLDFDRATFQDLIQICDGEYLVWKRNPTEPFPDDLLLRRDNLTNYLISICEDLHYDQTEIDTIFGSTTNPPEDTTASAHRLNKPYYPKLPTDTKGKPLNPYRSPKPKTPSNTGPPRRQYMHGVTCPLCRKGGHHPNTTGCDLAGALFSIATALLPNFIEDFLPRKHHSMAIKVMDTYKRLEENKKTVRELKRGRKDYIRHAAAGSNVFKVLTAVGKLLNPSSNPKTAAQISMIATAMIDDDSTDDDDTDDNSTTDTSQHSEDEAPYETSVESESE